MNNIFLPGNDPLLYNGPTQNQYYNQLAHDKLEQKYNEYLQKVNNVRQVPDKIGELDNKIKSLSQDTQNELKQNEEFMELTAVLQSNVQAEIMELVKNQLNNNPEIVRNVDRQLQIIKSIDSKIIENERKNMAELNDYLKNYSDMTFDDYKKLKAMTNEN